MYTGEQLLLDRSENGYNYDDNSLYDENPADNNFFQNENISEGILKRSEKKI